MHKFLNKELIADESIIVQPSIAFLLMLEAATRAGSVLASTSVGMISSFLLGLLCVFMWYQWLSKHILKTSNKFSKYSADVLGWMSMFQGVNGVLLYTAGSSYVLMFIYFWNMIELGVASYLAKEEHTKVVTNE